MKNVNVQTLKTSEQTFFLVWLKILQAYLKLGKQERLVLSRLLYHRYKLSHEIKNKSIVESTLMSTQIRKQIREELGMDTASFNNTLTALRKKRLIVNNKINNKIIPKVDPNFKSFKLIYNIEIENIQN